MITLHHHFEEIRRITRLEVEKRLTNNLSMAARIAEMRGDIDRMYSVINESILRDQIQLAEMVGAVRHQSDSSDYEHHTSAGESSLSTDGSHQSAINIIPGSTHSTTEITTTTRRRTTDKAIENDNVGAQQQSVAHTEEVVQVNDSTPPPAAVQAQIVSVEMNEDKSYFDCIDMKELGEGGRGG